MSRVQTVARSGLQWIRAVPFEALIWTVGLAAMLAMDPRGDHLFNLCPLDALGFSFCPGCGLGHAVAYLARGEFGASLQAHPLGGPAVLILGVHVCRLLRSAAEGPPPVHRS